MDINENLFYRQEYSVSAFDEMKIRIVNVMRFLKPNLHAAEQSSLMQAEIHSLFPALEQYLKDSFLTIVRTVATSKKPNATFSTFTNEFENLLVLIYERLSANRISYIVLPCISSIVCMMYYVDATFPSSEDILIKIFANYVHLREFILDSVFKTMTILQTQYLALKYGEKIAKSVLLLIQSVPTNLGSVIDEQTFEKAEQQVQSLIIRWISLFIGDIDSKISNEHLPKILNNFIRHLVKMLNFFKFPSAPCCLFIILRTLMSCLSSLRSSMPLKKLALEQICFIIINLKKMIHSSSTDENARSISNIRENLRSALDSSGHGLDVDICAKLLLIRYMENQYSNVDWSLSPIPFLRLNLLTPSNDSNRNEITLDGSVRKRKLDETMHVTYNEELVTYSHLLKSVSYELRRGDADVIYQFFVFSRSDLQLLVDRYFERIILITSVKNNSLRLSAVKQLVPLIEVNNSLLFSRIFRIAIRSLILDNSIFVRENILITLGKIVLLYEPKTYAEIVEENFKNILMRVLDVNVSVRKAVMNLLKNFCIKNRNHPKVLKILSCILSRIQDKNESVRFEAVEILKQLWFVPPESSSTNTATEIVYMSNRNTDNLILLFNHIFLLNPKNSPISLFDVCKTILTHVAHGGNQISRENFDKLKIVMTKLSQQLTKEDANYVVTYMDISIRPHVIKQPSILNLEFQITNNL